MREILTKNQACYLNLIRYLSCLFVFSGHFFYTFVNRLLNFEYFHEKKPLLSILFDLPTFGVMIFFVLSGFLITYSALIDIEKHGYFSVRNYIEKRCYRILPPLWFAILFTILIFLTIKYFNLFGIESYYLPNDIYNVQPKAALPLREIIYNFLLIPGKTGGFNVALWSLSYESFYYVIFAIVMIIVSRREFFLGSFLLLLVALTITVFSKIGHGYLFIFTDKVLKLSVVWIFGSIAAILFTKGFFRKIGTDICSLALIIGLIVFLVGAGFLMRHGMYERYAYGAITTLFICYILSSNHVPNKIITFIAKGSEYTYTLYLLHYPALFLMLSLLSYRLLSFHWYHYVLLYLFMFVVMNYLSYQLSKVIEDRHLMKKWALKLFTNKKFILSKENI